MKTVDARGQACPKPVLLTRSALGELPPGERLVILVDNPTSCENVTGFLAANGMHAECTLNVGTYEISVVKTDEPLIRPEPQTCCPSGGLPHIIVASSDKMGRGSDELGAVLMQALINIIEEVKPLPSHIVFYNSGIFLACEGSPLIETLKKLENAGVAVLVCGTCAKHFGKRDAVRVGTVSNMYTILEAMTSAGHIIQP